MDPGRPALVNECVQANAARQVVLKLARRHHAPSAVAAGVHAAAGSAGDTSTFRHVVDAVLSAEGLLLEAESRDLSDRIGSAAPVQPSEPLRKGSDLAQRPIVQIDVAARV